MLICVNYDRFDGAVVTKINQLRMNPKFSAGLSFIDQTLDQLGSTTGFVCFRCKEEYTVEGEKARDAVWIFEVKKGVEEYREIMGILFEAKLLSTRTAATIRSLIEQSRIMCDNCRRLERPLVSTIPTHRYDDDIIEMKPVIKNFTRKIEVQSEVGNNFATTEISNVNNVDSPHSAPSHVGATQDVSMDADENEPEEAKPTIRYPLDRAWTSNGIEPLSVMMQRTERERLGQPIEQSQEENQPSTSSAGYRTATSNSVIPPRSDLRLREVKREICEASLTASARTNAVQPDEAISTTTQVAHSDIAPAQEAPPVQFSTPIVEQQPTTSSTVTPNPLKRKTNDSLWLKDFVNEEPMRVRQRLSGLVNSVVRPMDENQEQSLASLRDMLLSTPVQPNTSAQMVQSNNISSNSVEDESTSMARDTKVEIMLHPQADRTQKSHFDTIANADTTNTLLVNMASHHLNLTGSPLKITPFVPRRSNDLGIPTGHCHLANQSCIGISTAVGFLPIYKVNHNCTQFQRLRVSDLKSTTKLRFHSSLLKRKTEEWIPVQLTEMKTLSTGEVFLHYNYEKYRQPGQMRPASKPVKLCCDDLLHFILIHTDDLTYKEV